LLQQGPQAYCLPRLAELSRELCEDHAADIRAVRLLGKQVGLTQG